MGGGGVDGAIHRNGGPSILAECSKYRQTNPPLPAGNAIATTAGDLRARHVIHTVGPVWSGGDRGEADTLARCYHECLRLADALKLSSIAFPSISTGAFGYPVHQAAEIAVKAVAETLPRTQHVREARFVLFDEGTFRAYHAAAVTFVPIRVPS